VLAIISDIHGNYEALTAVFDDMQQFPVEQIVCLGDIVGYGPDPELCTDVIMEKSLLTLMGNHDFALLNGPEGFNEIAAEVIYLTRDRMKPNNNDRSEGKKSYRCTADGATPKCLAPLHSRTKRWEFISRLPERHQQNGMLFVHGSPLAPITEYVFPDEYFSVWNPDRIEEMMQSFKHLCFCGHTHLPCAISSDLKCIYPKDCDYLLPLEPDVKYIFNSGSVGQPRDRDNRACYLLYDKEKQYIQWRRVVYDIETTVAKIEKMCGPDNWCAKRLTLGR
jgi:diadenosine tetraphosphatase ApaH/serine/threonine PP2A family protein phosphatase